MNAGAWLGLLLVVTFVVLPPGGEVPPVPKVGLGCVVDNDSSAFRILRGQWVPSARNEGSIGSGYLWNTKRAQDQLGPDAVEWRPEIPESGLYKVYARWVWGKGDRATNAPYTIHFAAPSAPDETQTPGLRQAQPALSVSKGEAAAEVRRVDMSNANLAGKWNLLGAFSFAKGTGGSVELTDDADNTVVADALKFTPVTESDWRTLTTVERGDLLWEETFAGDLSHWVVEGPAQARIEEGRLFLQPLTGEGAESPGMPGVLVWRKDDLPSDFLMEWDFTPVSKPQGFFLVFFAAAGKGGEDLFDPSLPPRAGDFPQYTEGAINCYHISYCRNYENSVNLRKNAGLNLVSSTELSVIREPAGAHHVELAKKGGYIRLRVDEKVCLEWLDEGEVLGPVLGGGKFGFREVYDTAGYYDNVRCYRLK